MKRIDLTTQEGVLGQIADILIKPIIKAKPPNFSTRAWLELMFHTEEREILKYNVKEAFRMPGNYVQVPGVAIQGIGFRDIQKGDVLWVRTDERTPDVIDVEACVGQGNKDHWYRLDRIEFCRILPFIAHDRSRLR